MPNSAVTSLALCEPDRILRAATHGRGVWDLSVPVASNSIPLASSVSPAQVQLNATAALTVTGQNFVANSVVYWNGTAQPTTYISSTQLRVTLSASDTTSDTLLPITVATPGPGGGQSQDLFVKIGPNPALLPEGIVNTAGFLAGYGVAPGSIASAFGVLLNNGSASAALPLPLQLNQASLSILDTNITLPYSAHLFYAGSGQINFQVPWGIRPGDTATFRPVFNGSEGAPISEHILAFAPGIFIVDSNSNQGAITAASTGQLAAAPSAAFPNGQPVTAGGQITVYCTGLGAVTNQPADGAAAPGPPNLSTTVILPQVLINRSQATVTFSGLTPGAAGLYQINAIVPPDTPPGNAIPLQITDGAGTYSNIVVFGVSQPSSLASSQNPKRGK